MGRAKSRYRSTILREAFDLYYECRAEFEEWRASEYERAAEACRDRLLNRRGEQARIDAYSLFLGNETHARAYASPELIEWWETHPRPSFEAFEEKWIKARRDAERNGWAA